MSAASPPKRSLPPCPLIRRHQGRPGARREAFCEAGGGRGARDQGGPRVRQGAGAGRGARGCGRRQAEGARREGGGTRRSPRPRSQDARQGSSPPRRRCRHALHRGHVRVEEARSCDCGCHFAADRSCGRDAVGQGGGRVCGVASGHCCCSHARGKGRACRCDLGLRLCWGRGHLPPSCSCSCCCTSGASPPEPLPRQATLLLRTQRCFKPPAGATGCCQDCTASRC